MTRSISSAIENKRILLIDDEDTIREIVQSCLENLGGWQVLVAASAQEGLAIATTEHPDAILLDGMMPHMDGITFLHHLLSDPMTQTIPVVFLTAMVNLTPQKARLLGAQGAIAKPFNPFTLAEQISQLLHWNLEPQIW